MFLNELAQPQKNENKNYQDSSVAMKQDTRKSRLTIEQISKLRKLSDLKSIEYKESIAEIRRQFAPAATE